MKEILISVDNGIRRERCSLCDRELNDIKQIFIRIDDRILLICKRCFIKHSKKAPKW